MTSNPTYDPNGFAERLVAQAWARLQQWAETGEHEHERDPQYGPESTSDRDSDQ